MPAKRRSSMDWKCCPAPGLHECVEHLSGTAALERAWPCGRPAEPAGGVDLATVRGQARAKRALEIAAAGGHNVLMTGPPGSGKTMLARAFASLLPDIAQEEAVEVAAIYARRARARRTRSPTLRTHSADPPATPST